MAYCRQRDWNCAMKECADHGHASGGLVGDALDGVAARCAQLAEARLGDNRLVTRGITPSHGLSR